MKTKLNFYMFLSCDNCATPSAQDSCSTTPPIVRSDQSGSGSQPGGCRATVDQYFL